MGKSHLPVLALVTLAAGLCADAKADLSDTIARVKPSIVAVGRFRQTDNPQFTLLGTGFAISEDTVATNAHVVAASTPGEDAIPNGALAFSLQVQWSGFARSAPATLLALDVQRDLAILRVTGARFEPLKVRGSDDVREGKPVAFSGFPIGGLLGLTPVTHRGIVSAVTPIALPGVSARLLYPRAVRQIRQGSFNIFQLDATAYPGNSGGPLFDPETGDVVGIISMVLVKGTKESALSQPTGITYAIPSAHLIDLVRNSRP